MLTLTQIKQVVVALKTTPEFAGLVLKNYQFGAVIQATRQTVKATGLDAESVAAMFLRKYL